MTAPSIDLDALIDALRDRPVATTAAQMREAAELLQKARMAFAAAYQAVGYLVHLEAGDPVPSEQDQTDLLNLLSRWESMSLEQIEASLPWPKYKPFLGAP